MSSEKEEVKKRKVRVVFHQRVEYDQVLELSKENCRKLMDHEGIDASFGDPAHEVLELTVDFGNICDADSEFKDIEILPVNEK